MDREKAISTLEEIKTQTAEIGLDSAVIAHKFIDKIIAMLKEQPRIVRCKDCKYGPTGQYYPEFPEGSICPCQCWGDQYYSWYPEDDWFCANGEPKDGVRE